MCGTGKSKGVIMKIRNLFISALLLLQASEIIAQNKGQKGIIKGTVLEVESGEKLGGANILIKNTQYGAASNSDGKFQIKELEPGIYTLFCHMIGYKSISIENVEISIEKPANITFLLSPTTIEGEEVIVSFEKAKIIPPEKTNDIDPDFTIVVDKSVDPDMIIAVDPKVDPGIFLKPLEASIQKDSKESINVKILDSANNNKKSKKDK
jgi:hypothetical protein